MILKNQNDIYIYFETIEQIEPRKVLDVGMFLKRIGCVSRKAMHREVSDEIQLDGIDFFSETDFPVWKNVYNDIMGIEEFLNKKNNARYELAILLGVQDLYQREVYKQCISKMKNCAKYVLVDSVFKQRKLDWQVSKIVDLHVESDCYYLLDLMEK